MLYQKFLTTSSTNLNIDLTKNAGKGKKETLTQSASLPLILLEKEEIPKDLQTPKNMKQSNELSAEAMNPELSNNEESIENRKFILRNNEIELPNDIDLLESLDQPPQKNDEIESLLSSASMLI